MNNEISFTLADISTAAAEFLEKIQGHKIILFEGEMGAGKTTFISEVCRQLGCTDDIGSPTFSLVNEYIDGEGNPVYHFDLYRIESPAEVLDIGAEEYFDSGSICFVEWPDRLGSLTPEGALPVTLSVCPDNKRLLSFRP